jgi:hypothetical protein
MSSEVVRSGIGTSITFGTSGFTARVKGYTDLSVEREILDGTHMGTAASATAPFAGLHFREKCPGDLATAGDLQLDIIFDPDANDLPIAGAEELITIQFTPKGGDSTGPVWSFNGFVSKFGASIPHDGLMTGDITVVMNGEPTWDQGVA